MPVAGRGRDTFICQISCKIPTSGLFLWQANEPYHVIWWSITYISKSEHSCCLICTSVTHVEIILSYIPASKLSNTVKPLLRGHLRDQGKCPLNGGRKETFNQNCLTPFGRTGRQMAKCCIYEMSLWVWVFVSSLWTTNWYILANQNRRRLLTNGYSRSVHVRQLHKAWQIPLLTNDPAIPS